MSKSVIGSKPPSNVKTQFAKGFSKKAFQQACSNYAKMQADPRTAKKAARK